MNDFFRKVAVRASDILGTPWAFIAAFMTILVWIVTGPVFHYSNTWQLIINTGTTIITFLMVFLIQNTQNRDMKALHLKLDELLRGVDGARTQLVNLQDLPDEQLEEIKQEFQALSEAEGLAIDPDVHQAIIEGHEAISEAEDKLDEAREKANS